MSGKPLRPPGTSGTGSSEAAASGPSFRRIDPAHPIQPRRPIALAAALDSSDEDLEQPGEPQGAFEPGPSADRLLATQAAQLADYLRDRQSDLALRQQQLDDQHQSLQQARDQFALERQPIQSGLCQQTVDFQAQEASDEGIELLLEQLEQQRLAHAEALRCATTAATAVGSIDSAAQSAVPSGGSQSSPTEPTPTPVATGSSAKRLAASAQLRQRLEDLQHRESQLARRTVATQQLLYDVRRMHQESLEVRIVTEQLWVQLAGRLPHDELTRSLRQLRLHLDEHYRLARAELVAQQQQLRNMLAQLEQQQQSLRRQRRDLQTWVDHRYAEFEQEAAQLLARQQDLERQQRQFDTQRTLADEEVLQYQRQIRQLTAQLRCRDELGRVA